MDTTAGDEKSEKRALAELKNGKILFRQKPMTFEKNSETMSEIIRFREMLENRISRRDPPLPAIPDEHKPLIAKLAHESDKTVTALAKHIRSQLLPSQDEDDINSDSTNTSASLPLPALEAAIKSILSRTNYGLDGPVGNAKTPAAACVWRWEVKPEHREWLPKALKEKIDARQTERTEARKDLQTMFEALSQEERDRIIDPKRATKPPTKDQNQASVSPSKTIEAEPMEPLPVKKQQKKSEIAENVTSEASTSKVAPVRAKKEMDPDKIAKEKERLEKKAAKAEKEKKEKEAQNKSRSLMAGFFNKPKTNSRESPVANEPDKAVVSRVAGPSSNQSAFEKTFKPFVIKKDAELAHINWFLRKNKAREVIVIDDDGGAVEEEGTSDDAIQIAYDETALGQMTAPEHLRTVISSMPLSVDASFTTTPRRRFYAPRVVTRDIVAQLSEAEIADDPSRVGTLLSVLRNRNALPAKVLIFADNSRPGYFGTWTRHSQVIGPRKPLERDLLALDYAYDSGEEWEDEGNDNADDVVEGAEDDDVASEADSDLDSWLVSDDEVEEIAPPSVDPELDAPAATLNFPTKRKADDGERKIGKKRKVVIPLVPFVKGPCWESAVGQCSYEPFEPYRIQLFNDTPYPINPFTFVSAGEPQQTKITKDPTIATTFAVPSLPDRILTVGNIPSVLPLAANGQIAQTKRANAAVAPKTSFPEVHLPALINKINTLATGSIILLVEAIFQELREHKVKKNSIEAKVKEIAEKGKDKKIWVLKSVNTVISQP
ncbi:hypothetical protein FIBSPDRAFT_1044651 [Athelia psychrophila]|uniref:Chromatin assembly factor 1 subunit A dimerization domain-containing protein n=1 Tax=Athelia psychrophila TaxID=1759441 RepID=A0A166JHK2_9AGAM|nr:hypothetical protein FIBSPDRAFT_1044651 [Fibularhizoctonia sp. CBS 109695]